MSNNLLLLLILSVAAVSLADRTEILVSSWKFIKKDCPEAKDIHFDDRDWENVELPHTWNSQDGQVHGNYYRGVGWYRSNFKINAPKNKKGFIQLEGSSIVTDVYLNGQHLGTHHGGYSTFRFDISYAWNWDGPDNIFSVKVDNTQKNSELPISADYTQFGGIYRQVKIIFTDQTHFTLMDSGSSGVSTFQSKTEEGFHLDVHTKIFNSGDPANITVTAKIKDDSETIISSQTQELFMQHHSGETKIFKFTINNPRRWNGRIDPYLHTLDCELTSSTQPPSHDRLSIKIGFREFGFDSSDGFILNGQKYHLHGTSMHQDRQDVGWAITHQNIIQDASFVKEIGATALRLAHYQHDQLMYDLMDEMGIVVWAEIPFVNAQGEHTFADNAQTSLYELIRQNINHPCIVTWSISNELRSNVTFELSTTLDKIARMEDPNRPTVEASCCVGEWVKENLITDLIGFNRYFGWYDGQASDFAPWVDRVKKQRPSGKISISEYGAGASIHHHQSGVINKYATTDQFHPEEYQSFVHETLWPEMYRRKFIWGTFVWNMFDFAVVARDEGDVGGRNDKGLVTFDRSTRKDAFYYYKANWRSVEQDSFVRLASSRHVRRWNREIQVKAYSNNKFVSLIVNNKDYGRTNVKDGIAIWKNVPLVLHNNNVTVKCDGGHFDSAVWYFDPSVSIDCGHRLPRFEKDETYWYPDHHYVHGDILSLKQYSEHVFENIRHGEDFTYKFPTEAGDFTLLLYFVEHEVDRVGDRLFDVFVNDNLVLKSFDIIEQSKKRFVGVVKSLSLKVQSGSEFTLRLKGVKRDASLAGFSLVYKK